MNMTRDEWIESAMHDCAQMSTKPLPFLFGLDYDRFCRLIDSRIAAAVPEMLTRPAPVEAGPVVVLREGQVWWKGSHCGEPEALYLAVATGWIGYYKSGSKCGGLHDIVAKCSGNEQVTLSEVAPILTRFGFTVRDETSPPGTSSPAPATKGERFGCRIVKGRDGMYVAVFLDKWYFSRSLRQWDSLDGRLPECLYGYDDTIADCRITLASAPPPPGWSETAQPPGHEQHGEGEKRGPGPKLIASMKQLGEEIGRDRFIAECRKVLDDYAILSPNKLRGPDVVGRVCDRLADALLTRYRLTPRTQEK